MAMHTRRAARLGATEVNTTGWPRPIFLGDYMHTVLLLHTTTTHGKLMKCWHAGTLTIGQFLIAGTRIWGDDAETARAVVDLEGIKAGLPYGAGGELRDSVEPVIAEVADELRTSEASPLCSRR
ncbi:hypothetical protein [Saccharopolyspora shandongensis]|uniref:hypothetical protein n=1 Tax=Saccharopolyspora shandongensis TaxID=418495 RepID=UPI0033F4A20B